METIYFLSVSHTDCTDFNNAIRSIRQTGGFKVKCYKFSINRTVIRTKNCNNVIHIVHVIAFTAKQNLYRFVCSCNLRRALPFHRVQRICKRLNTSMVCNGNRTMTPRSRLFNSSIRIGERIHIAHNRVQVKFDPFHSLCSVLTLRHRTGHNGCGLQYRFVIKLIYSHTALYF